MKHFFTIVILIFALPAISQTISGYVYDEAENKPLEGAFVYLDGTTLSSKTNADGFFSISASQKYNAALIVSFVGYQTARIENPFSYGQPFKVVLREDVVSLNEVVINKKQGPFTRGQMMKAFKEQFLGQSRAGSSCEIENEEDITLYFDTDNNTLHAEASKPLRIINERLRYKVDFTLVDFVASYRTKSLLPIYVSGSYFAGTTFFTDIAENKEKAERIRKEKYLGSTAHLMKTIVTEDWEKQKFSFFVGSFPGEPKEYFAISDSLEYKKVTLLKIPEKPQPKGISITYAKPDPENKFSGAKFNVLYDNKEQSAFAFNKDHFYVDRNGLFFPIYSLVFGGYLSGQRAGDLLPADYEYKEEPQ